MQRILIERALPLVSLAALLIIGLVIFADFGVSWDENQHLDYTFAVLEAHIFESKPLPVDERQYYGRSFDIITWCFIKPWGISDARSFLLAKHLSIFLFFALSVVFFFLLCRDSFGHWIPAYLACVFLVLHPRIFGHAFYNPKDLPLMSAFIVASYTLVWYLRRRTVWRGIVHGFVCAVCVDIRVVGLLLPALTLLFLLLDLWHDRFPRDGVRSAALTLPFFFLSTAAFTVFFWPFLWAAPFERLIEAFQAMGRFAWWDGSTLYMGEWLHGVELASGRARVPWHYIPVWIAVTTPITIVVCAALGLLELPWAIKGVLSRRKGISPLILLPHCWFFLPLVAVIVMHSVLYSGWRQMFFIYPALVMIAVRGAQAIWRFISRALTPPLRRALAGILVAVACLDFVSVVGFMIRSHPYQSIYFNPVAGSLQQAQSAFDFDYWGIAYRELLERILRDHGPSGEIIVAGKWPVLANWAILPSEDRKRLVYFEDPVQVPPGREYYLLRSIEGGYNDPFWIAPAAYTVAVDGAKLAVAVRVRPGQSR